MSFNTDPNAVKTIITGVTSSVSQFLSNTSNVIMSANTLWGSAAEIAVTYAATITLDFSTGYNFGPLTLTGNVTLANPVNMKIGQSGRIRIVQDTTGSRTISFGTYFKTAGGIPWALTTTASATDFLYYEVITSTFILYSLVKNVA